MVRLIVIAVAVFLGIYLLARWYDLGQASPNEDAVVSKGASKVLILVPESVAILLFVLCSRISLSASLTFSKLCLIFNYLFERGCLCSCSL